MKNRRGLTLLTPTGDRALAWKFCQRFMLNQTFRGPVHWVIVDDGAMPNPLDVMRNGWTFQVCRPRPFWTAGQNTQARNLRVGLSTLSLDARVAIIEDDDFYHPAYLETVSEWLDAYELVGESKARYYNVRTRRFHDCGNDGHASLCSTAMRGAALAAFQDALRPDREDVPTFIDCELWASFTARRRGYARLFDTRMVIGMKGLPGRAGIGSGHRADMGTPDPAGRVLREWVGDELAADYFEGVKA